MKRTSRKSGPTAAQCFESQLRVYSAAAATVALTASTAPAQIVTFTSVGGTSSIGPVSYLQNQSGNFTVGPFQGGLGISWGEAFGADLVAANVAGSANLAFAKTGGPSWGPGTFVRIFPANAAIAGVPFAAGTHPIEHRLNSYPGGPYFTWNGFGLGAAPGYIGFKAQRNGHDYYGWLRVNTTRTNGGSGFITNVELVDNGAGVYGAYALKNSLGGGNILAGQVTAIPEPAAVATGLGLLALGAAGVREHRRRLRVARP